MSAPYNVKQALLAAYRHLLTPLVRILLRNGISYLEFAEVTREVFVKVAGRDFTLPKRKISLSRIAIMTGLSRKEVARLAKQGGNNKALASSIFNRVTRVLQGWYTDARIQETAGIAFTPMTLTQKLDGTSASGLTESFGSRFGACSGSPFTAGIIAANGSVCGVVGVCTIASYTTYQFDVSGTDPAGRPVTFSSPVLQLAPR